MQIYFYQADMILTCMISITEVEICFLVQQKVFQRSQALLWDFRINLVRCKSIHT